MSEMPGIEQIRLWLSKRPGYFTRGTLLNKFPMPEGDLDWVMDWLEHQSLIKNVARLGKSVQSFTVDDGGENPPDEDGEDKNAPPKDHIFITHGRNMKAVTAMLEFLRALGLTPITFQDALRTAKASNPYINQILAEGMAKAYAAIVLFTGDEEARLKPEYSLADDLPSEFKLLPQPRPNVIFEAGMALALFGDRAIIVQHGPQLRPISNIAGRYVLPISNTVDHRRTLKNKLKTIGCLVTPADDYNFLNAGDFSFLPDHRKNAPTKTRRPLPRKPKGKARTHQAKRTGK